MHEPQTLYGGKVKQDVVVIDSTDKATVTLWESSIGLMKPQKSYQLNRLESRSYRGKQYLSFPTSPSIDEIKDLEEVIEPTTSLDEDDEELIISVAISGFKQLETIYSCMNCNDTVHPISGNVVIIAKPFVSEKILSKLPSSLSRPRRRNRCSEHTIMFYMPSPTRDIRRRPPFCSTI